MVAAYVPGGGKLRTIIMLHQGELLHPKWNDERTVVWLMDHGRPVKVIKEVDQILPWDNEWLQVSPEILQQLLLTPTETFATLQNVENEQTQSDVVVPPASGEEREAV